MGHVPWKRTQLPAKEVAKGIASDTFSVGFNRTFVVKVAYKAIVCVRNANVSSGLLSLPSPGSWNFLLVGKKIDTREVRRRRGRQDTSAKADCLSPWKFFHERDLSTIPSGTVEEREYVAKLWVIRKNKLQFRNAVNYNAPPCRQVAALK